MSFSRYLSAGSMIGKIKFEILMIKAHITFPRSTILDILLSSEYASVSTRKCTRQVNALSYRQMQQKKVVL